LAEAFQTSDPFLEAYGFTSGEVFDLDRDRRQKLELSMSLRNPLAGAVTVIKSRYFHP